MWRGKDVAHNILGYLVFAMYIETPFIAYREPRGGAAPGPPLEVGGDPPPSSPPCEARLPSVRAVCKGSWGGCCGCLCWWGSCPRNATRGYIKCFASRVGYTL